MNEIMTFVNEEFGLVRSTVINGEPWLVGIDISRILGYSNASKAVMMHVDNEDKISVMLPNSQNGNSVGKFTVINESGFYSLVLSSKMPKAKEFKHWVTGRVLPTIRKTGGYVANEDMFAETYLPFADEAVKNLFKLQCQVIDQLNNRIRRDEPKVKFADHVAATENIIDMNSMAKLCADNGIRIGRTRLFAWLKNHGILMLNNLPYQEYVERGYFKVKESVYECKGKTKTYQQTYVTGKGQQYILNRLLDELGGV